MQEASRTVVILSVAKDLDTTLRSFATLRKTMW